ncbi:glycosyl transferase [Flavobacterium noncentrifugens]|uniref:Glycosyltransferase involved in cell wall bisynthesis n=1 Tax=Flavobacterium noncentrifugens TaxID=1128970 RepID=A0A1G8XX60_9FLAO|nr:glycosyltransferase [Flavobacterium noncentrifugens]GEP52220.1 glycosyl transferase [Flavobacterium noncentrifugens]SDJ95081.1 Glycosyltransferase involved in cell wall bisynthesis [Flavobacterium noncentrifugens]
MENLKTAYNHTIENTTQNSGAQYYDMIVFCHLRWDFVYQRPQHLISRMSKDLKILLIEEPVAKNENGDSANLTIISKNLHILQPMVDSIEAIGTIIPQYVKNKNVATGWFYSAAFSPLLQSINFDVIVYDCMDELSLFKGAPQHLIDQEKFLLSNADIVFTGGKSLYESKKQMHSNVYCFPSSVDEDHFSQSLLEEEVPNDMRRIDAPIVGYFGVIDERIDYDLIRETASLLPKVNFVMIGPFAKVEERDLPRAENIHYLGMKNYAELPNYLRGFDIAMMPFALNDATKYISPTKTLEYMAAGKPIISTKITDVVSDYSHCVKLISTATEFATEIESLLEKNYGLTLQSQYRDILDKTSWDATASRMKSIIKTNAK